MTSPHPLSGTAVTRLMVVRDVAVSRRWYEEVLGAELYREYGGSSAVMQLNGTWLLLVTGGEPTDDKPTVSMAAPANPDVVSAETIFRVEDCVATYEALKARGAEFLTPPVDRGFEIRAFFRDPDGHLFEISQA